jgi:hypothetical protein
LRAWKFLTTCLKCILSKQSIHSSAQLHKPRNEGNTTKKYPSQVLKYCYQVIYSKLLHFEVNNIYCMYFTRFGLTNIFWVGRSVSIEKDNFVLFKCNLLVSRFLMERSCLKYNAFPRNLAYK